MARLKGPLGWLAAALIVCGLVAFAYLPPRGMSRESRASLSGLVTGPPTAERLRANELAKAWRRAALDVQLHEWRRRLGPELERLRAADQPTIVTVIDSAWPAAVRERARSEIDKAWQALELGTTKIGVAVVVEAEQVDVRAAARGNAYLLPDSVERHVCVAWTAPHPAMRASLVRGDTRSVGWHAQWARSLLGPCAFYAQFGRPSVSVERWLAQKQHRFVQIPAWDSTWTALVREAQRTDAGLALTRSARAARLAWVWRAYSPLALGCMSGRASACRDAAVGTVPSYGTAPPLVTSSRDREFDLPASTVLLNDMIRELGHARFARFWVSDLAPDSAFHIAMDTTLGDWVLSRVRRSGALTAGPTPGLGASASALGVAALGIALTLLAVRRRQVA